MPFFAEFPFPFFVAVAFIFGLLVGSFLNVVIWRVPRGESIVFPGSHCGSCGAAVKPYDNIPVISYLILGGKCRACKKGYSWIYPAVEFLTGLLFLAVAWKSGPTWVTVAEMAFIAVIVALIFIDAQHQLLPNVITYPSLIIAIAAVTTLAGWAVRSSANLGDPAYSRFADYAPFTINVPTAAFGGAALLALAIPVFWLIDRLDDVLFGKYFDEEDEETVEVSPNDAAKEAAAQRIHNRVVYGSMILGFLFAIIWAIKSWQAHQPGVVSVVNLQLAEYEIAWVNLLRACLGALVGGGIIWLLRAAYFWTRGFEGMGLGDVKMMGVVGAFLGWQQSILVIMVGSLLGSVVGLILARRSSAGLRTALPFGIFLGIAAILSLFFGESVITWYAGNLRQ